MTRKGEFENSQQEIQGIDARSLLCSAVAHGRERRGLRYKLHAQRYSVRGSDYFLIVVMKGKGRSVTHRSLMKREKVGIFEARKEVV